jgi:hypothetical protein
MEELSKGGKIGQVMRNAEMERKPAWRYTVAEKEMRGSDFRGSVVGNAKVAVFDTCQMASFTRRLLAMES